jgi:LysM repeat protein
MDTISRDSNSTSYAPIAAVIIGLLALVLSIVGLVKVNSLTKKLGTVDLADLSARVDSVQSDARSAVTSADAAKTSVNTLASQTQRAFDTVTAELGNIRTEMSKAAAAPKSSSSSSTASSGGSSGPAEPGTYVVKSGDTGVKIAKAAGVSLSNLMGANPDVDWNRLKVGQKIKVPGGR